MSLMKWKPIVIGIALMMALVAFCTVPMQLNNDVFKTPEKDSPNVQPDTTQEPTGELYSDPVVDLDSKVTAEPSVEVTALPEEITAETTSIEQSTQSQDAPVPDEIPETAAETSGSETEAPEQYQEGEVTEVAPETEEQQEEGSQVDTDVGAADEIEVGPQPIFSLAGTCTNHTLDVNFATIHLNSNDKLIGFSTRVLTPDLQILELDPVTLNSTVLRVVPEITAWHNGADAIDNDANRLYIIGRTPWGGTNTSIFTFNSLNGSYIQNFTVDRLFDYLNINSEGEVIGFVENLTSGNFELYSIDPGSGITTLMDSYTGIDRLEAITCAVDPDDDILYQMAYPTYDPTNPRLYKFNSLTGAYIENVSAELRFNNFQINDDGFIVGIAYNPNGTGFQLRSIDPETGLTTHLANFTDLFGFPPYGNALDRDDNIFYQVGTVHGDLTQRLFIVEFEIEYEAQEAIDDTEDLIVDIEDLGIHNGTENSLTSKLNNVIKKMEKGHYEAAINQLNAFIREVEAQRGKKLTDAQADDLIAAAEAIKALIETLM